MNASNGTNASPGVKADLLAAIPRLRVFAISLCGRSDMADDLVQETLVKAWAKLAEFTPDTNMAGWLYTILRNEFYTRLRKRRHEVDDPDGTAAAQMVTLPAQESRFQFRELREALQLLPPDQREALILVGATGLAYEEAAQICGCAVGTIKSRVNRARTRLEKLLVLQSGDTTTHDSVWRAIVKNSEAAHT